MHTVSSQIQIQIQSHLLIPIPSCVLSPTKLFACQADGNYPAPSKQVTSRSACKLIALPGDRVRARRERERESEIERERGQRWAVEQLNKHRLLSPCPPPRFANKLKYFASLSLLYIYIDKYRLSLISTAAIRNLTPRRLVLATPISDLQLN